MSFTEQLTRGPGLLAGAATAMCALLLATAASPASANTRSHAAGVQTLQTASKARALAQRAVTNAARALKRCARSHPAHCGHERRVLKRARARLVRAERRLSALERHQTQAAPVSSQSDAAAAQTASQIAIFEAESMTIPSNSDTHSFNDSLASAGKALSFPANGAVTKTVTSGTATTLTVRARGDQCYGAPRMVVLVDGRTAMSVGVSATSWTDYSAAVSLAAGSHKFSIEYANDYIVKGVCDRNLRADKVSLQTSTTATTGSGTGTGTTTSPLPAPTLTVSGQTLNWTAVAGAPSYIVDAKQSGFADQYTGVTGTSFTPPAVAGATLQYSVRAAVDGSAWSLPVSITYAPAVQPSPPPPAPTSPMVVGMNGASYGTSGVTDVKNAVNNVRLDSSLSTTNLHNFESAGVKIDLDFSGPYNSSGVSGLNAGSWVSNTLNFYKANTNPTQTPYIEVLNEPGGTWFWGPNALSQTNADAYRSLLQQTYNAFHAAYGSGAPKILATFDGSSGITFGKEWWTSAAASFVDGIVVHPYGGTGDRTSSALGNRQRVSDVHAYTGKPIYVTEIGWPTCTSCSATSDSLQWSEADQAANLTNFVDWARGTGYVAGVWYFNYHDFGTKDWYGVVRSDGSRKPAYDSLKAEAEK